MVFGSNGLYIVNGHPEGISLEIIIQCFVYFVLKIYLWSHLVISN